ncbi:MAG: hypothetical protein VKL60_19435 [Sphaerospermopsis sp.]|nr:hypothetical protein [Sphaerospermopsis sp.]
MSYTEGSEDYMKDAMDKDFAMFKDITKRLGAIEKSHKLSTIIDHQLSFADQRLIEATNAGIIDEQHKWSGYRQALLFVQSEL